MGPGLILGMYGVYICTLFKMAVALLLVGHVSKIVSILLSKLSDCPIVALHVL